MTFKEWNARACKLANALLGLGLEKGDRVALLAYNRVEWMEMYIALAKAGIVAVPINFRLVTPEIQYIVEHCHAKAIIAQDELAPQVEPLRGKLSIADKAWICIGDEPPAGWAAYEALVERSAAREPGIEVKPTDTWALMYTSGTTGKPKGAIRNHEGMALMSLVTALDMGLTRDDTALLVMPMCHANSLNFGSTFTYLGATVVVDDRKSFDPEALLAKLAREKVTFTSLVPTHYIMMLDLPDDVKGKHDVGAVGKLLISSAPARKDTKLSILKLFPNGKLFELYGSTEAGWVTILRPDEQIDRLGSVGREWAGSGAIRILDGDGREVPDGEVGELHSRTAYVFDGYWKNPDKTAEAFKGAWCSVGDLARRDGDGFIHLVDRKSNMIISGGENIYPSEVEAVLAAHPQVQDVAVIGMPDAKWGESVQAVVVLRAAGAASEAELLDWCKGRIASFKRPKSVAFIAESQMPRTATGKIQHRVLRDRLAKGAPPG
jgi:fatty-acyl-CoA synthase